jgi:predicted lipid-binding transport protein (Tim44 family)
VGRHVVASASRNRACRESLFIGRFRIAPIFGGLVVMLRHVITYLVGEVLKDVYDGFDNAIRERETKGETAETRFVSIDRSDITAAEVRGSSAQVTVRFVSQLVSVTRDRSGNVIDGNPDKVTDVTDVWTFARDLGSRDPNWKLVATEAGQ